MKSIFKSISLLFICAIAAPAWASQIAFNAQEKGDQVELTYRWYNADEQSDGMIISINADHAKHALNDPKTRVKPKEISDWLFGRVKNKANEVSQDGYTVMVARNGDGISIDGAGPNRALLQQRVDAVHGSYEEAAKELEQNSYYRFSHKLVSLNYPLIVSESYPLLGPLAQYFGSSDGSLRGATENFLAFLQSIPYEKLDGDDEFGLHTPIGMLLRNSGDCESKQLALATLIRGLSPSHEIVMIGLVDHVVLGVKMQPKPGDQTFQHNGLLYVLMDATGPSRSTVGQISSREVQRLREGKATVYSI